jgi:DNA-binding NarL/FixJ family response regulator
MGQSRMPNTSIRLVVADDHTIVLHGLASLLALEPDLAVVATCTTGEATVDAVRKLSPDILLLDVRMPGLDGFGVLRALKQVPKSPRVILLSAALADDEILEAMRLGVAGVILKERAPALLLESIRTVHAGDRWIDKDAVGRALERVLRREAGEREIRRILTSREMDIVRLVAQGLATKTIASRLSVTEGTVKTHLHHIYEKLDVGGRVALTLFARDRGIA